MYLVKKILLGIILIAAAAAVLLLSDLDRRIHINKNQIKIAINQFSSRPTLDDTLRGILESLKNYGYIDGSKISITRYNAENDLSTANAIAKEITDGRYDMVISISTPSLQTTANANTAGKAIHVFATVTDPAGAGVGISRTNPLDHPKHLAGIGTFQPVEKVFRLIKQINPDLKKVGVVWNPNEACSTACLEIARRICKELSIELIEAAVDNSSGVFEAASSLLPRGVQAIWIGGDNTVELASSSVISAAKRGRIPVFTNNTDHPAEGALLGLGANYFEVGKKAGAMSAEILNGSLDPSDIPIEDVTPPKLIINIEALNSLKEKWTIPENILKSADSIIDSTNINAQSLNINKTPTSKKWNIALIKFNDSPSSEENLEGVISELKKSDLTEGKDFKVTIFSAQNDMPALNSIIDRIADSRFDMIITLSTPTLQAAMNKTKNIPIVFTYLADPIKAGAGKTYSNHLPNVTGAFATADYKGLIQLVKKIMPQVKTVGSLYNPGEVNSYFHIDELKKAAELENIKFISVGVNSASEITNAALALCAEKIDAITQIPDNLMDAGFSGISDVALKQKIPLFGFTSSSIEQQAFAALARDYRTGGEYAARIAVRIMKGEKPDKIPFQPVLESRLLFNKKTANTLGINIGKLEN